MNKRFLIAATMVTLTLAVIGIVFLMQKGTLVAELNPLSTVSAGAKLYIANKHYPDGFDLPLSIQIRPGTYEIIVLAPGAADYRQEVTIKANQTTKISVTLVKDTEYVEQQEITPSSEELADNKYLTLFPYTAQNYSISAKFLRDSANSVVVDSVTITPFLPVSASGGFDPAEVQRAKNQYVAEAKLWLKEQGISESVPVIIDSVY